MYGRWNREVSKAWMFIRGVADLIGPAVACSGLVYGTAEDMAIELPSPTSSSGKHKMIVRGIRSGKTDLDALRLRARG